MHFKTTNLPKYFEALAAANALPTIEALLAIAAKLYQAYSTTDAYEYALSSLEDIATKYPEASFTVGPRWDGKTRASQEALPEASAPVEDESDDGSEASSTASSESSGFGSEDEEKKRPFQGDWVLANGILLKRDGIWFLELCRAVACGDIGCVWEILKVSVRATLDQAAEDSPYRKGLDLHVCRGRQFKLHSISHGDVLQD